MNSEEKLGSFMLNVYKPLWDHRVTCHHSCSHKENHTWLIMGMYNHNGNGSNHKKGYVNGTSKHFEDFAPNHCSVEHVSGWFLSILSGNM